MNCKKLLYNNEIAHRKEILYNIVDDCVNIFDKNGIIKRDIQTYNINTHREIIIKKKSKIDLIVI